jgi:acetyl-CoA carboxylase carboxyl transferase subunit beta
MGWFKRLTKGITTKTTNKREVPDGLWNICPKCKTTVSVKQLEENFFKCPSCSYHFRIGSYDYYELIFDNSKYTELYNDLISVDMLDFVDLKPYKTRLEETVIKTNLIDSMTVGFGKVDKKPLVIAAMDFNFIGGSMGSVMGEKIARAVDYAIEQKCPLMIISKSGGARMMESAFSLMQMAKTTAKLTQLAKAGLPYFSYLTDPTTGGVTASFAMIGDINIAEPAALIGFAGPRVIKETIKKDLPEGFQTAEFLLEKGFIDFIVDRKDLKSTLSELLSLFNSKELVSSTQPA